MECPHCNNDLKHLETEENIVQWHTCPKCHNNVWLDFEVNVNSNNLIDTFIWLKMRNTDE